MDRFDPFSADYLADPYPHLARARTDAPVFYAADLDMWVVSRYADIEAIFTDPATFSAAIAQDPVFPLADEARTTLREGGFRAGATMSNCDPPKHTRIRRHNLRAFSARRTAALEPRVRAAAEELVTAMLDKPRFDVVEELTYPLPAYMIFTLIGFPPEDTELLKSYCGNRMAFSWGRPTVAEQTAIAANMARYWRYCERFVADRIADAPRRLHQRPRPGPPRRPRGADGRRDRRRDLRPELRGPRDHDQPHHQRRPTPARAPRPVARRSAPTRR